MADAAILYVPETYAVRPQLMMRERSLPGFVRSMTTFQLVCALAQLVYDTDPSRRRLLVDFVGQGTQVHSHAEYVPSKVHLLAIDVVLWLVQLMVVALTVEEMHAEADPTRANRLDAPDAPLPTEQASGDDMPLLDAVPPRPGVLPTTQQPIAVIHWSMLWQDSVTSGN
ncbi:hypothetical protein MCAP1_002497 [Malassezia caprae]|uniref:DUF1746 domain-containing protein n=1 Tax=Malassezia caprae TaxID=1381934 RepID=A0AAF0E9S0_9BASI|nr:hypothetical protein MCAP1_002497 [Malassezia caprae]